MFVWVRTAHISPVQYAICSLYISVYKHTVLQSWTFSQIHIPNKNYKRIIPFTSIIQKIDSILCGTCHGLFLVLKFYMVQKPAGQIWEREVSTIREGHWVVTCRRLGADYRIVLQCAHPVHMLFFHSWKQDAWSAFLGRLLHNT